ncbi:hypothetical protein ACX3T3_05515 [Actinotignum schaalii]
MTVYRKDTGEPVRIPARWWGTALAGLFVKEKKTTTSAKPGVGKEKA